MSIQDNLKFDQENFTAWNAHDIDRSLAQYAEDIVWTDVGMPEPLRGREAVRQYIQGWFSAFPDIQLNVTNRVVSEDQVAGELEWSGTQTGLLQLGPGSPAVPATGKKVAGKGTYFVRIRDNKAVEVHTYPDNAGLMIQLGLMSMPAA